MASSKKPTKANGSNAIQAPGKNTGKELPLKTVEVPAVGSANTTNSEQQQDAGKPNAADKPGVGSKPSMSSGKQPQPKTAGDSKSVVRPKAAGGRNKVTKPTVTKPTVTKPTVTKPKAAKSTVAKPTAVKPKTNKPKAPGGRVGVATRQSTAKVAASRVASWRTPAQLEARRRQRESRIIRQMEDRLEA